MHKPVNNKNTPSWYIVSLVYAAGEPIDKPVQLQNIVRKTMGVLSEAPLKMTVASVRGRVGNSQPFSPDNFAMLLADPEAGALRISGLKSSPAHMDLRLYLRHNPGVALKHQPPGVLYFIAECGHEALSLAKSQEAAHEFLHACANGTSVLHGGISAFINHDQARSEASLIGSDVSEQPESFVKRWNYDASNATSLWQKARHLYWTTLLGPSLARQAGGAAAALASGAVLVTEVADSLIFTATESVEDSLDLTNFSRKTRGLREWLWPYLIQNPHDHDQS
jgi:hypothetical protein